MSDNQIAIDALKRLMSNPHISLGDLVYTVREREGEGWDGKYVKEWSDAVVNAEAVVKYLSEKPFDQEVAKFGIDFYKKRCIELEDIVRILKYYGMIHTVKGVVYPDGSHQEYLDKAEKILRNPTKP